MTPTRTLVLVHSEGWQRRDDFEDIAAMVRRTAPDIDALVASNDTASSVIRRRAAERPALIVSPIRLNAFQPRRGKVYAGQPMSKLDEMRRLSEAGLPVPAFEIARPDTCPDPAVYGSHVVEKPTWAFSSWGRGITLHRIADWTYRPPDAWPEGHPARQAPLILQRFVDCGRAMTCRVLTLFGRPILTYLRRSTRPLQLDVDGPDGIAPDGFLPAPPHTIAHVCHDPDILALATAAHAALPEIPLLACDILRDRTGALHLLETNPGGGTWMFSSKMAEGYRRQLGVADLRTIFDATRVCAEVLVERTRADAI